ncbi:MAG: glycosyltransferase, partial [Verrucomicrobia bacterium]|nr:glycosyltransferase [Verrucomicrobiota bacterium]
SFLANRLPDREARADEFFFKAAEILRDKRILLAGNGWHDKTRTDNIVYLGHLYTAEHNAFNCSARAVLNVNRLSMAQYGFSPATRVFEAAGARACIISDQWKGIDEFFEPGEEILLVSNGQEVAQTLHSLTLEHARSIGSAAYKRALSKHTYAERAKQFERIICAELVS